MISCLCNVRHGRPEGAVRGGGRAGAAGAGHPAAGPHPAGAGWPGELWLVEAGHVTPVPTSDWSRAPGCRCRSPAPPPRAAPPRHPASRGSAPQVRSPSSSSSSLSPPYCKCPCPESGPRQPDEIDMVTPANHLDFSAILPLFPSLDKLVLCFQTKRCGEVLLMTAHH